MPLAKTGLCELCALSGTEILADVRSGRCSCREVVEAHIEQITRVNPVINAVVVPLFDHALQQASVLDDRQANGGELGPLHGLPVTVKESIEVAGTPSTLGLTARRGHRAESDAAQVELLKNAGAIVLGKTNVSLLLKAYETNNPVYGRTCNPWNKQRAPGGSSGGEAAIVASHGSAVGMGSDLSGSIRLPVHACGINGLRPTSGRMTMLGHARVQGGEGLMLSQPGPMARTVADLALTLKVLTEAPMADPTVPRVPWREPSDVRRLKVAFFIDNGIIRPSPAIRRVVLEAATALRALGVQVEEWQPPDLEEAWELQLRLMCADGLAGYRTALQRSRGGRARLTAMPGPVRSVLRLTAEMFGQKKLARSISFKQGATLAEYFRLLGRRRQYLLKFYQQFEARNFDAILCPPDALPAIKHDSSQFVSGCSISYAGLYTLLGMPAGVVAASRVRAEEESDRRLQRDVVERAARFIEGGSTGLPIGVQVAARHWREDIVLSIMGALENSFRAQPDYPAWTEASLS